MGRNLDRGAVVAHSFQYDGRNQSFHRAAQTENLLDEAGADVGILFGGHHEDGFKLRGQAAVHQCHLEFVFVITDGADAAQDGLGTLLAGKLDQEAVKGFHGDVSELMGGFAEHFDAIFGWKKGLFFSVVEDGDDEMVEDLGATGDQVEMAVGRRVEAPRVDGANSVHWQIELYGDGSADAMEMALLGWTDGGREVTRKCKTLALYRSQYRVN